MNRRPLGRTGEQVSTLSLGGAAFGDMYGTLTTAEATACIDTALDAGINLIDTSPFYGKTRSETVLGNILAENGRRNRVLLGSKAGRNDLADFDFSADALTRSVEASLKRLQTDRLDYLIAHDIEFAENFEQVFTETAETLANLKSAGKCRFIGMSCLPLGLLREAIGRCNLDLVVSYTHHTLQNRRLTRELMPMAEAFGVGVLNASPLCMGLLTPAGPPDWHPAPAELRDAAKLASAACEKRGTDLAFLGMQFALQEPRIASTITGTARPDELAVNLRALSTPIDLELLSEVEAIFAPVMNVSWPSGRYPHA